MFLIVILVVIGIIVYDALSWGLVLYLFYPWFVLPVFDLPEILFIQAVGLSLFISLFKNHNDESIKSEYIDNGRKMLVFFSAPWIVLFMGWLIHSLFM